MKETMEMPAFSALAGAQFMVLTTFRRDGRAAPTTVWFAQDGGVLYGTTSTNTGKAKRMRATERVTVTPSTWNGQVLGPEAPGSARILAVEDFPKADAALLAKYPEYGQIVTRANAASGDWGDRIFFVVSPR